MLPHIKYLLKSLQSPLLQEIWADIDELKDLYDLVEAAIVDDPPISIRDGGFIKEGYHEEIDRLRHAKTEGKSWLARLEAEEREKTGIKTMKVKYNKVFGYYLEVTNSIRIWYRIIIQENRH